MFQLRKICCILFILWCLPNNIFSQDSLTVDSDSLKIQLDSLTVDSDSLNIQLTDSLTVDSDSLNIQLTDSLTVDSDSLNIQLDSLSNDSTSLKLKETTDPSKAKNGKKSPQKSLGLSAIYPGLGQWNNNQIYKSPIFAGLFTSGLIYTVKQGIDHSKFNKAYKNRFDATLPIEYPQFTDSELLNARINKKRKYNLALAGTIVIYSFNLLDAYTSALKKKNNRPHSPVIAAYRSAVLPGWGQVYNKKKWKVPIVYGGFAVGGYFLYDNFRKMDAFTDAYVFIDDPEYQIDDFVIKNTFNLDNSDELLRRRDLYRNRFELSIFFTTAWYLLNIIDATVDGHLYEFDQEMLDDLSLEISPFIEPSAQRPTSYGLSMSLKF